MKKLADISFFESLGSCGRSDLSVFNRDFSALSDEEMKAASEELGFSSVDDFKAALDRLLTLRGRVWSDVFDANPKYASTLEMEDATPTKGLEDVPDNFRNILLMGHDSGGQYMLMSPDGGVYPEGEPYTFDNPAVAYLSDDPDAPLRKMDFNTYLTLLRQKGRTRRVIDLDPWFGGGEAGPESLEAFPAGHRSRLPGFLATELGYRKVRKVARELMERAMRDDLPGLSVPEMRRLLDFKQVLDDLKEKRISRKAAKRTAMRIFGDDEFYGIDLKDVDDMLDNGSLRKFRKHYLNGDGTPVTDPEEIAQIEQRFKDGQFHRYWG